MRKSEAHERIFEIHMGISFSGLYLWTANHSGQTAQIDQNTDEKPCKIETLMLPNILLPNHLMNKLLSIKIYTGRAFFQSWIILNCCREHFNIKLYNLKFISIQDNCLQMSKKIPSLS